MASQKLSHVNLDPQRSKLGQEILDLFEVVFKTELDSPKLAEEIQQIKAKLYDRDYLGAFDNSQKNKSYMARWSPARALGYTACFSAFEPVFELLGAINDVPNAKALCIGAGAGGEFVAMAAVFSRFMEDSKNHGSKSLTVDIVDIAEWGEGLEQIYGYIRSNWMYGNDSFSYNYKKQDVLCMTEDDMGLSSQNLITMMFTTNELFSENKAKAVKFLQTLNQRCQKGCLLLILESAGSFSHIQVGSKTFPIQFLVDTILCGRPGESGSWELLSSDDSCWFRAEKGLEYSLKLENMRFFYRVYQKQ